MLLTLAQWLAVLFPASLLAGPAVAEIIASLISALFLAHSARTRDWQWLRNPWVILMFALCVMFVISGLLSPDPATSAHRGALFIRFPLFVAALAFWAGRDERTQRRILLVMLAAVAFLALDMLIEYVRGYDLLGHARITMPNFVRLHGPYNKPHAGSALVWIAFPAIFYLLDRIRTRVHGTPARIAAFLIAFVFIELVFGMIHVSGERAAFLSCLLGLVLAIVFAKRLRWFFMLLAAVGGIAFAGIAHKEPEVLNMQVNRVTSDVANFKDTPYGRLWLSAWHITQDYPLFGVGTKRFRVVCLDTKYGSEGRDDPVIRCGMHPHNIYLEILSETGIFSLLLFLATLGYWTRLAWAQRGRVMADPILCGLVITCIIRFWPIASTPSHFAPWFASPLWFVVGLTLARLAIPSPSHEHAAR